MVVREILAICGNIDVKVFQAPIERLDGCKAPVLRQYGSADILLNSNQNYLDFEVLELRCCSNIPIVLCKANKEQEERTIRAYRCGI